MTRPKKTIANQLIIDFLSEIMDSTDNINYKQTLKRAQESVRQYPIPLSSGAECLNLKYIGEKIAVLIDKKFKEYYQRHGIDIETLPKPQSVLPAFQPEPAKKKPKSDKEKKYIPSHRSGGYAMLLALFLHGNSTMFMSREEIIKHGQQYCDKSFLIKDAKQFYGPWNSMKTLLSKDLVCSFGRPARYSLTEQGLELCALLKAGMSGTTLPSQAPREEDMVLESSDDEGFSGYGIPLQKGIGAPAKKQNKSRPWETTDYRMFEMPRPKTSAKLVPPAETHSATAICSSDSFLNEAPSKILSFNTFTEARKEMFKKKQENAVSKLSCSLKPLAKESYEIVLVIDNREVRKRTDRDFFQRQLEECGVKCLTMPLALGDVCWCARDKNTLELYILDHLVERKCNSDLIASIQDNRFKEQKVFKFK